MAKHPAKRSLDMLSTTDSGQLSNAAPWAEWEQNADRRSRRPFRVDDVSLGRLQAQALSEGASRSEGHVEWDVAGKGKQRCIAPIIVDIMGHEGLSTKVGNRIFLSVRCRKCEPCLKARSSFWKLSAMTEIAMSQRTWFLSLTYRPEERVRVQILADRALRTSGVSNPCAADLFRARLKVMSPDVTNYLKRLRQGHRSEGEAPVSFRYLLVWEDHKCECAECELVEHSLPGHFGFPHAHLFLHEQGGHILLQKRIYRHWKSGFSDAGLVEKADPDELHKRAAYICKYISKSMLCRVRASRHYGANST